MQILDWIVLWATLLIIVTYGIYKTRKQRDNMEVYVRGDQHTRWWTIGLSVMATQASAITFLSTPGQAFHEGLGFIQFYFGLPLAMVIICVVFIPIYHRLKVYTAYEYLENRFDLKTRILTAILFLIQRGLAAGITIFAPAIILSAVLGWPLKILNVIIGVLVILYTVSGGTKAVNVTQKQQMAVIMIGMVITFILIVNAFPEGVDFSKALNIASINGKLKAIDFSLNPQSRYTFWSGITGGLFLALSYFGTDQSQVQRYLSGQSLREKQLGLVFNGLLKIPMQFFILFIGVMVFVFYQYHKAPLHFNPAAEKIVKESIYADDYRELELSYDQIFEERQQTELPPEVLKENVNQENKIRHQAKVLIAKTGAKVEINDKDYVFITYILDYLPTGIIGLLLAVILSAAMSSTASELNALGVTTAMDIYQTTTNKKHSQIHYLKSVKWFTFLWGVVAILFANFGTLVENLIQLVNIIGSIFYGNVLGVFLIGFFIKYIRATALFYSAIITQIGVILIYYFAIFSMEEPILGYLWLNAIGCVLVIILSIVVQWALLLFRK